MEFTGKLPKGQNLHLLIEFYLNDNKINKIVKKNFQNLLFAIKNNKGYTFKYKLTTKQFLK